MFIGTVGEMNRLRHASITQITRGRRRLYCERPRISPPLAVRAYLASQISEHGRMGVSFSFNRPVADLFAEIAADVAEGDPRLTALRKCAYVIENAPKHISDPNLVAQNISEILGIIREYGEPEGAPLVRRALKLYGGTPAVDAAAANALARIGSPRDFARLASLIRKDPECAQACLQAIIFIAERHPAHAATAIRALNRTEHDNPAIKAVIEELGSIRDS